MKQSDGTRTVMKKLFLLVLLNVTFIFSVFPQVSVDPSDRFYHLAQGWHNRGIVEQLPLVAPYPAKVIRNILETVIENGDESDSEKARAEYERIFSKPFKFYVEAGGEGKVEKNSVEEDEVSFDKNLTGDIGVQGDISFKNMGGLVDIGYSIGFYGTMKNWRTFRPYYENPVKDAIYDAATVGPVDMYLNLNTLVSVGKENVYVTAGISRLGFGPFHDDGIAINSSAYHTPNITFNLIQEKWSFASIYETLGATTNLGGGLTDSKYLCFHAFQYRFIPQFSITYYENVLFGPQNDIIYLIPAPYMAIQNIGGANSNLQMGLLFEVKPAPYLNWATDVFVDDISVDELVKLDFDTKIRIALQTGLIFTPENSLFTDMSVSYTAVMPYTYAHWEYEQNNDGIITGSAYNYQNYTNNGLCMGSPIPPNSDRVMFKTSFNPFSSLKIDVSTSFLRHQNTAEQLDERESAYYVLANENQYKTDGSIFMHQVVSGDGGMGEYLEQAQSRLGFMSGTKTMHVCQAGIDAEFALPKTKAGQFTLKAGYTFELVFNAGVDRNIFKGGTFSLAENEDGSYTLTDNKDGSKYDFSNEEELIYSSIVQKRVQEQRADWFNSLYNLVNHYFYFSVKYTY